MRVSWISGRRLVAIAAALVVLQGTGQAIAQFSPLPQTSAQTQNQAYSQLQTYPQTQAYAPAQSQVHTPNQVYPQNPAYSQNLNQIYSQNPIAQQSPVAQQPQMQPQYTAMAYQANGGHVDAPVAHSAPGQVQAGPGCNTCQTAPVAQPAPVASYRSCDTGGCASGGYGYNAFANNCGYGGSRIGFGSQRGCRKWFGGFYGLYMERAGNPWRALAFSSTNVGDGYYPVDNEVVLNLTDVDNDTFAGAEFRIGSTIGQGSCGCGPQLGWEFVYWGLLEEDTVATVTDVRGDANRLYGMIGHTGAFYNTRSVNDYYDYAPPVSNPTGVDTVRVRQFTARNRFSMQNLELNLLRFSILGDNCCGGAYGGGRLGLGGRFGGGCASGGCDTGGCDPCAGGSCGIAGGCGAACRPRHSVTGLIGFRYMRIDEDFGFRADYENETANTFGFISHDIDVDSHLAGAQFGCNAEYQLGCSGRWALHCRSVVGVFGNHSEVWNRMDAPVAGGPPTNNDTSNFDYRYEDDNISVLGELRIGASYQYSCNWRLFGGYRLMGLTGMALAFDQISDQNISAAQTSYVNSSGSIFLHGLQGGIECTY